MYFYLLILLVSQTDNAEQEKLKEMFNWRQVDFQFPNNNIRRALINSKRYIQANNSMFGLEVWKNKLFITVPRWYVGVGSTLNYVELDSWDVSPLLNPYPNYGLNDTYSGNLSEKIICATRIFIDSCNRLWVPDNGKEELILMSPTVLAPPKIIIIDLNTNKILRIVIITKDVTNELSSFFEIVVDINKTDCNKAYAYLPDTNGYGLLVYSWETNTLRRISNSYFFFEPQSSVFNQVQIVDGIVGMALSQANEDGFKTLYFHALSSYNEYKVSTQALQDPSQSSDFTKYQLIGNRGERSQSTTQRLDERTGVIFYTQVLKNGIGCWNSKINSHEYSSGTNAMVVVDRDMLFYPCSLTLDSKRNVWVLSNNFLSFKSSILNPLEYNYRVMFASVESLIKETLCSDIID